MILWNNQWKFWTISTLQLSNRLSGKRKPFSKNWSLLFQLKALRLKMHHFHTKLPYQRPMLRQIELWVQNRPITKNGVLPVTNLFLWFFFRLRTSYKELSSRIGPAACSIVLWYSRSDLAEISLQKTFFEGNNR